MKLSTLAAAINAEIHGNQNNQVVRVAPIASAKAGELTFLLGGSYRRFLPNTKASAVVLTAEDLAACPCDALVVKNPELAFAKALSFFERKSEIVSGIHSSVIIGEHSEIDPTASISPGCVIGNGVRIGAHAIIGANNVIGDRVVIGSNFHSYPNVSLYHDVVIGDRVILHSGVVLGSDGFGLTNDQGCWIKIPQIGTVVIGNDVEIGANTTIDRGALDNTVIEEGVKIDNQVQIAHNVHVGMHTAIAGCVGIAGSAYIGQHCMIGGGVCINGHITIADRVVITGMAMVLTSIDKPGIYSSGTGIQNNREWRKSAIRFQQLDSIVKRLRKVERLHND